MRYWIYSINSYYKTATITLEEFPLWLWLLERISGFVCDVINNFEIPLPDVKVPLRRKNHFTWVSLKKNFGTFGDFFHLGIHLPIFYFCEKRKKKWFFDYDYEKLKDMMYERDKGFWDFDIQIAQDLKEIKEYLEEE